MKQTMATKKRTEMLNLDVDADFNWDSVETMRAFYAAEIKKAFEMMNKLSVMENAKQIISLCSKIKIMKRKVVRGW